MFRIMAISILIVGTATFAQAQQEPIVTDRPDQTESASIVPAGWLQVEAGVLQEKATTDIDFYNYDRSRHIRSYTDVTTSSIPGVLLRLGLSEQIELRFGFGYLREEITEDFEFTMDFVIEGPGQRLLKTQTAYSTYDGQSYTYTGLDAFSLGTKVAISEENGLIPQSAILATLVIPGTGAKYFETEWLVPEIRFAFAHTLSDRFSFGYNLAAMWDGASARHIGYYSFVIGAGLVYDVSCFAEIYGDMPGDTSPLHRFDAGLTWLISGDLQLDASYGVGLTEPSNDWKGIAFANAMDSFVSAGVSWRVPLW